MFDSIIPVSLPSRNSSFSTFEYFSPLYTNCTQLFTVSQFQKICGLSSSTTFNPSISTCVNSLPNNVLSSLLYYFAKGAFPIDITKVGDYCITMYHSLIPSKCKLPKICVHFLGTPYHHATHHQTLIYFYSILLPQCFYVSDFIKCKCPI
jgi:hypothetical protein